MCRIWMSIRTTRSREMDEPAARKFKYALIQCQELCFMIAMSYEL